MRKAIQTLTLSLALTLGGCAARVVHPGAANKFDSSSYDTLLVTHSVIESTKADLAANKFPAAQVESVRYALNGLITAYNVADSGYLTYHAAALKGQDTLQEQTQLQSQLMAVQTATTQLATAKGATK